MFGKEDKKVTEIKGQVVQALSELAAISQQYWSPIADADVVATRAKFSEAGKDIVSKILDLVEDQGFGKKTKIEITTSEQRMLDQFMSSGEDGAGAKRFFQNMKTHFEVVKSPARSATSLSTDSASVTTAGASSGASTPSRSSAGSGNGTVPDALSAVSEKDLKAAKEAGNTSLPEHHPSRKGIKPVFSPPPTQGLDR
jgi:hypothetical protein